MIVIIIIIANDNDNNDDNNNNNNNNNNIDNDNNNNDNNNNDDNNSNNNNNFTHTLIDGFIPVSDQSGGKDLSLDLDEEMDLTGVEDGLVGADELDDVEDRVLSVGDELVGAVNGMLSMIGELVGEWMDC